MDSKSFMKHLFFSDIFLSYLIRCEAFNINHSNPLTILSPMLFKNNTLIAAPMAGISDPIFRTLCREHGADIVVSEMVSVEGILYGADATMELMRFSLSERPIGIQLFGSDPDHFKRAAIFVTECFQPDFIDINAGCPAQKIVRKNGGASLLRNLELFEKIIKSTIVVTDIPVTVKLRSGWNKHEWVDCEFAACAEASGVAAITLHPRSQTMMFSGHSFWDRIALVKSTVKIPVIGNGDISTAGDAVKMKNETGCDCIMIGRGSCGNPWIFSEIKTALAGGPVVFPTAEEKGAVALRHIALFRERFGERCAAREMKKHTSWYIKGAPGASLLRDRIFRAESSRELEDAVKAVFGL
jgi:nifR3 family TIM-barrel protein